MDKHKSESSRTVERIAVVMFLLAWVAACLPAADRPPPRPRKTSPSAAHRRPRPTHPVLTGTVLPSGMRLLLEEDPYAAMAGMVAIVSGGSAADPPGREGLAHLVEHLSYRAVDPPPSGEPSLTRSDRLIKYAAADSNGFTSNDWLMFYEFAPPSQLSNLLRLEAARLIDPLLGVDEAVFTLERQIIGSEHLLRSDPRAGGWASNAMFSTLFTAPHPYSRPLGGTDDSRRRLTLADAQNYVHAQFRPEKITLLVSAPPGLTSLDQLTAQLPAALQGDLHHPTSRPVPDLSRRPAAAARPKPVPVPPSEQETLPSSAPRSDDAVRANESVVPRVQRKRSPLPTPELWLAWTLPGAYGASGPLLEMLQRWVQEDLALGRLSQEESHIRHIATTVQPGRAASVLFVRVLVSEGANPERVAQVVSARVSSLWAREPIERDLFIGFRSVYETEQRLDKPAQVGRALQQVIESAMSESVRPMRDLLGSIQAITSSAVAEFAYQQLTQGGARAVLFSPFVAATTNEEAHAATAGALATEPLADMVPGAAVWDPRALSELLPGAGTVGVKELPSGMTIMTVRRPGASVVAWLAFRGGYADADPPLVVELALRARPDAQNAPKLHILPGRGATRDMSFDMVEFEPAELVTGLTLLFAKATTPVRDWPAREGLDRMMAPIAAAEDGKAIQASRAFWRALLGDSPAARLVATSDLDKLTRSDVDAWLGRVHHARNAALVVIGDVDPGEVERGATILSRQLQSPSWVAPLPALSAPVLRPAGGDHVVSVITGRPGTLTEIRLGCLLPPLTVADRASYELLRYTMEARLNGALRVNHGDGYGVNVGFERLRGGTTYLVAATFVPEQSLSRSLATVHSHWQRWSSTGFEATELNVGRWRYASTFPVSYASGHAMAFELLNTWNAEPAALREEHLLPELPSGRSDRVKDLFATCRANAVLAVSGNEAYIRRALEKAWPKLTAHR